MDIVSPIKLNVCFILIKGKYYTVAIIIKERESIIYWQHVVPTPCSFLEDHISHIFQQTIGYSYIAFH